MGTESGLSQEQEDELRARLDARLREVRSELRDEEAEVDAERSLRGGGDIYGPGEQSTSDSIRDVSSALISRERGEINAIRAALRRLDEGTYGVCIDCAEPIGYARLGAYLSASRCTACQTAHESSR